MRDGPLVNLVIYFGPTKSILRFSPTLIMDTTNHTSDYSILKMPVILGTLLMLAFVSACAGANPGPTNAAQGGGGPLPTTPATVSSGPAPQATTSQSVQMNAASPAATPTGQEHLVGIASASVLTIHGTVVKVNRAKKLVTLEGPDGKQVTLHVYNPYNLAAAKAGVPFVAKFYEIATVRKKQPGESVPVASVAAGIATAMPGQVPGTIVGTRREIVVTVVAINVDEETVAVKGPDGSVETITVANPANLKYVKVGDQIVLTLTNVVAIVLEKESAS
jgi:hypothetical protein